MTLQDLIFLFAALATFVTLLVIAALAAFGCGRRALRIFFIWAECSAVYLAIGLAASFFGPQRVLRVGQPMCFDDWCLTALGVSRSDGPRASSYTVSLRISSRALRVSQRAKGAWIYLIDDRGHLYPPNPDPATVPLDVLLAPGEVVETSRTFQVPGEISSLGLVTGHGGPYCGPMSYFVIGDAACLFGKPPMIRIR